MIYEEIAAGKMQFAYILRPLDSGQNYFSACNFIAWSLNSYESQDTDKIIIYIMQTHTCLMQKKQNTLLQQAFLCKSCIIWNHLEPNFKTCLSVPLSKSTEWIFQNSKIKYPEISLYGERWTNMFTFSIFQRDTLYLWYKVLTLAHLCRLSQDLQCFVWTWLLENLYMFPSISWNVVSISWSSPLSFSVDELK